MSIVIMKHKSGFYTIYKNGKTLKNRNGGAASYATEKEAKEDEPSAEDAIYCNVCCKWKVGE